MKKLLLILLATTLTASVAEAAKKRPHVVIQKPLPVQPIAPAVIPLIAIPPLAVAFDLARRTSCDPNIAVSTGKGDPGFDPAGPKTGNFLIPAIYNRCQGRPQPR